MGFDGGGFDGFKEGGRQEKNIYNILGIKEGVIQNYLSSFSVTAPVIMRFCRSECSDFPRKLYQRRSYFIKHPKATLPHQNAKKKKKKKNTYQIECFIGKKNNLHFHNNKSNCIAIDGFFFTTTTSTTQAVLFGFPK